MVNLLQFLNILNLLGKNGITNAIIHRSYAITGEHIKVFIYDDRIEIISPGKLPGLVTIENIRKERYARNPQISRVLTDLGLVRELNEGVERIYTEMKEFFLDEPLYEEPNRMLVKLTLKNNIAVRKERKNENLLKKTNIKQNWKNLNTIEQQVLQIIFDKGKVGTSEIAILIDRDRKTVQRILKKLEKENLIRWIGTSIKDPKKTYSIKMSQ